MTDTTAEVGAAAPIEAASRVARSRTSAARSGSARSTRSAPRAAPAAGGASPVSKMNVRATSIKVLDHGVGGHDRAALASQRLRQRHGADHVGRAGKARLVDQAAPAGAADAEAVRLVDDQQRAVLAAGRVQAGQRRQIAVDGEHRIGDHQRPGFAAGGERRAHGGDVAVPDDGDPRAGQTRQASTIDAWLPASETTRAPGPDRAVRPPGWPRTPRRRPARGGPPRKAASSASNSACSCVLPVTRREPVEPAPHVRRAVDPRLDHPGVAGQAQVVVGGEVEHVAVGGAGDERPAQPGGGAPVRLGREPGEGSLPCHVPPLPPASGEPAMLPGRPPRRRAQRAGRRSVLAAGGRAGQRPPARWRACVPDRLPAGAGGRSSVATLTTSAADATRSSARRTAP